mmetsp:Transcript_34267/g.55458  ORF Transcript_34267/g.55458 Transcript_34267/m.55458 type:complete len:452 (+) Transcript_34267:141-1496(+)|eukprot:CAMPEP_0184644570 /NCGR_PEP_ID=MMETSP0308-20130426/1275_1 /TAXON_ID=38269 /ORGANISM="Gloeochaete witrockiana, Strain SAG 46.84" /LENGTH=451 /DNA_ID=CAMNT_0027073179 /DNA_START=122 /DNA_END=1477 /DNA_ORIENTATION=+
MVKDARASASAPSAPALIPDPPAPSDAPPAEEDSVSLPPAPPATKQGVRQIIHTKLRLVDRLLNIAFKIALGCVFLLGICYFASVPPTSAYIQHFYTSYWQVGQQAKILNNLKGALSSVAISSALKAGIFDLLDEKNGLTAQQIAAEKELDPYSVKIVMDALVVSDIVSFRKSLKTYSLNRAARKLLVSSSFDYVGGFFQQLANQLPDAIPEIDHALHHGAPSKSAKDWHGWAPLAESTFEAQLPEARGMAKTQQKDFEKHNGTLRILDLGCGSGVWGYALAEAMENAEVTFVDSEDVLAQTSRHISKTNVRAERTTFLKGDMLNIDLKGPYDLILAMNIFRFYSNETATQLAKTLFNVTAVGGRLLISDMLGQKGSLSYYQKRSYSQLQQLLTLGITDQISSHVMLNLYWVLSGAGYDSMRFSDNYPLPSVYVVVSRTDPTKKRTRRKRK